MATKMAVKKAKSEEVVKPTPAQTYPKATLLRADRWKDRKDLLNALLDDGKVYTIDQVDQMISDYYNKEV